MAAVYVILCCLLKLNKLLIVQKVSVSVGQFK